MTVQVAAVIFLVIHLTVCVMAVIMKKSGKIKSAHMILPAVFLVPVCGCFLLIVDEWQVRHTGRKIKDVEDYADVAEDELWHREIITQNDDELTVPLEEAMTVNSPSVSRKLMMKLLHTNPEQYVELLKKVTLSDDVELTHYATTSVMEIQSHYEDRIGKLFSDAEDNPDDTGTLVRCRKQLKAYIDSGLISDTVLMQYRRKLADVLQRLCIMQPAAVRYKFEYIENSILIGKTDNVKEQLEILEKEYPDDVRLYKLYVQYYYFTNNGAGISDVISKVKNRGIYLDSEGKQWFDAWNPNK